MVASSVRARHSSSSKVERNFAYSNFLLFSLLPLFFKLFFVSKFSRGFSPPSYHIQSTWVNCQEWGILRILSLFFVSKLGRRKRHSLIQEHNHLLACASKQSWNASIAVTIALLLHKVHLHMTTITLWSDIIFHHDLLKCLVFSIVDFMIGRRWWGRRCWC